MTGMKRKLAALLLMLTLIVCQSPAIAIAEDTLAGEPITMQEEQTPETPAAEAGSSDAGMTVASDKAAADNAVGEEAKGGGTAAEETAGEGNSKQAKTPAAGTTVAAQTKSVTTQAASTAPTAIENVTVNVTVPSVGATNVDAGSCISISSGEHYSLMSAFWPLDEGNGVEATKAGPLAEGTTYYINVGLKTENGYFFRQGSQAPTTITVNGATLVEDSFSITNMSYSDGSGSSIGSFAVKFTPAADSSKHTVSFDTRGHYAAVQPQTVSDGGKATKPNKPADDENASDYDTTGLHFRNWSEIAPANLTPDNFWSSGFSFASTTINSDKELYAISWAILTLRTYDTTDNREGKGGTVTYSSPYDSGTTKSIQTTIIEGTQQSLTATPESGYEFVGWAESPTGDIISEDPQYTYTNNGKRTLYALFAEEPIRYLCTGRSDGGTLVADAVKGGESAAHSDDAQMTNFAIPDGAEVTLTADTAEGYVFRGWYEGVRETDRTKPDYGYVTGYNKDKKLSGDATYTFTLSNDANVYALFEQPTLTIELDVMIGKSVDPKTALDSLTVNGEALSLSDAVHTGTAYVFTKKMPVGRKVTINAKATDRGMVNTISAKIMKSTDFTHSEDGSPLYVNGTASFTMADVDADVIVYLSDAFTVNYDANGGTPGSKWPGEKIKLPLVASSSFEKMEISDEMPSDVITPPEEAVFAGVEVTDKNGTRVGKPGTTITGNDVSEGITIKYLWNTKHTVSFNAHGGTPVPTAQKIPDGEKATKPADPSKTGFHLLGWFTKTSDKLTRADVYGNIPPGFDFANTAITADTELHAAWYADFEGAVYDITNNKKYAGGKVTFTSIYQHPDSPVTGWSSYSNVQGSDVTITAIPDDNYVFVAWAKDSPDGTRVSTDQVYTFTFEEKTTLCALFEKRQPVLTVHWSSPDGVDLMQPYKISVQKGTTILDAIKPSHIEFKMAGYKDSTYRTNKPITEYKNETELLADCVDWNTAINADTDIYYVMYKEIDSVKAGVESPVCGVVISNSSEDKPYGQNDPPRVSVPEGRKYQLRMDDGKPYAYWAKDGTTTNPFAGQFKGGDSYYARFMLNAEFGYVFAGQPTVALDNAEVTLVQVEDAVTAKHLVVGGKVVAVHNWGDWEVTKEPTETEEGEETRTCKTVDCGAEETRAIPVLTVEYRFTSGDGSEWKKGSSNKLNFVVKRNRNDADAIKHFRNIKVDGKDVPASGFSAQSGSVVIDLMPSYLETLADGNHTLTAVFDDGNKETSASFKVVSASDKGGSDKGNSSRKKGSPDTGDQSRVLVWLMIFCTAGLALSDRIIRRLKKHSADR